MKHNSLKTNKPSLTTSNTSDFLIAGAGIIGVTIALKLKERFPDAKIIIIEKEHEAGMHASGRNSGVLHAGFYYTKDSLKAKFTKEGNAALTSYCHERQLPINHCGKLVVARNENDLTGLDELLKRAQVNDIILKPIDAYEAREIEPRVKTFERALFSPSTSTVNPKIVLDSLIKDAKDEGIELHVNTRYLKQQQPNHLTTNGNYSSKYFINCAGLYADQIARQFGFSKDYRILPFKGLYLYSKPGGISLNTHIYPVPDLNKPFLGTHFTLTVDNQVKIGPTAIPAFWREHYTGFDNFNLGESLDILRREAALLLHSNFGFRELALEELKKYSRRYLIKQARALVDGIENQDFPEWGKPGIRAQLLNLKNNTLEMDFVVEGDDQSFHVLNAVSPAFSGSLPFAEYISGKIATLIN